MRAGRLAGVFLIGFICMLIVIMHRKERQEIGKWREVVVWRYLSLCFVILSCFVHCLRGFGVVRFA